MINQGMILGRSNFVYRIHEEIWAQIGNLDSITSASFPKLDSIYLIETEISYPVSFNGKMRFKITLPVDMQKQEIEESIMNHEKTKKYIGNEKPKRIIIVPNKIINIVF